VTPRDIALALAGAREQEAALVEQAGSARARALRLEGELLRTLAADAARQAAPRMSVAEALDAAAGELTRTQLLRLTRGATFRVDLSRSEHIFDRAGFLAWLSGRRKPHRLVA
jgi:hypothetical protein